MPKILTSAQRTVYRHEREKRCPRHGDGTGPPCMKCVGAARALLLEQRTRKWDSAAHARLMRHFLVQQFWPFFLYGFGARTNPKGERWIDEQVHKPLADWLDHHGREWLTQRKHGNGQPKRLAVVMPRETGKTTLVTQAFQLWLHLNDPEMSSATGSETIKLSTKILGSIRAVLDGSDPYALFSRLYGNWAGMARTWSGTQLTHAARRNTARTDPSFFAFGVETSITGSHPDAIFYDDPISYERLETDGNWLSTVNSQVDSLIPVVQGDGLIVYAGTRYDDGDHIGVSLMADGVRSVSGLETDSLVPTEGGMWDVYFLAGRDKDGKATAPRVWSLDRMRRYEAKNPLRFAAQVMNDPTLAETNPITREQIDQCKVPKDKVPWGAMRYAVCCDTAFAKPNSRSGRDWSVMVVHGYPRDGSGDVYVVEAVGSPQWRSEDFYKRLVSLVQRYQRLGRHVFAITDEMEVGGKAGSWPALVRNYFSDVGERCPMLHQFDRQYGPKKISRIEAAATFWVDGHVRWVEAAPGMDKLTEQIARIGQMRVNPNTLRDFADAHADAFRPELYAPMRRLDRHSGGYVNGARALTVDGLDPADFRNTEESEWMDANPRPPLRN